MINFDALILKAFIDENKNFLTNAAIKKIQQPTRRELILQIRNNGENRKLYININPEFFHICFTENLQKRGIFIPNEAPMFCMLLRKYIQNAKISKVNQPFGERIIEFFFEYKDVLEEVQTICLAVELMGKYSNIILYNYDTKIILGCAHNVSEEKSKKRELAGTLPYIYPEKQLKNDILSEKSDVFAEKFSGNFDETSLAFAISNEYFYLTIPLVKQVLKTVPDKSLTKILTKLKEVVSLQNIQPSVSSDYSEFSLLKDVFFEHHKSVNSMIDNYFEHHQISKIINQKKAKINLILDNQIQKLKKQIEVFKTKLSEKTKAEIYKLKGDILMINVNSTVLPKVVFQNPYDGNNIEIELDTKYSVVQNANRYYKLYKKTKNAVQYAENKIEETQNLLKKAEEQKFYTEISSSIEEIEDISEELGIKTDKQTKKTSKQEKNLEMREVEGFKVYLGKNSLQNDYLLSKIASPEDLWFHPLNMHGAHVILKCGNQNVSDKTILACAKIAKRFSKAQQNAKIPIIYTKRRYVKKANSKIAFVTYKNEKEIYC